jgi:hypothetical protein
MTVALSPASAPPIQIHDDGSDYRAGACNIGKDEIDRRRRFGHLALITAIALFVILVAVGAPPVLRAIVALPAAVAAACYIEAYLKFCIRFGWLGLFNFGAYGTTEHVADKASRDTDRRRAQRLVAALVFVLVAVAAVAVLLPV